MSTDLDVLCFGEALVDLLPDRRGLIRDCERFAVHSGGAPANVAVGLARLGMRVGFRGVIGDDEFGHLLERKLAAEGVELSLRATDKAKTGLWFIALSETGERSFFAPSGTRSADKLIGPDDADPDAIARARWLHVGTSAHVLPAGQEALRAAVESAALQSVRVSFDPNIRAHLWADLRQVERLCAELLPLCDFVKIADDEVGPVTGETDPEKALDKLQAMGIPLVCVTRGEKGAWVGRGSDRFEVPAPRVEVADTTGAGDAFVAAMLSRLAAEPAIQDIPLSRLQADAAFACWLGSRVCTALGAVAALPRAGEIAAEFSI
jgi:fructokinase